MTPAETTVVLLAAGHGKRMLPLTRQTPKPLLKVVNHSLIEHHLLRLKEMQFENIVINVAYFSEKIMNALGDGSRFGLNIVYSDESSSGALETAGGLKKALALIESDIFITVNADIWTDFEFTDLLDSYPSHAKLVMIDNPQHNLNGDFALNPQGYLTLTGRKLTYSGIACYRQAVFNQIPNGKQALAPLFRQLIAKKQLEGLKFDGEWHDIGTPQRLHELRDTLKNTISGRTN